MYVYQESLESIYNRMAIDKNFLAIHQLGLDNFLKDIGFLDYKFYKNKHNFSSKGLAIYDAEEFGYNLSFSTQVKLKNKYIYEPKSGEVNFSLIVDYVIQKENAKPNIVLNLKYNQHVYTGYNRTESFAKYFEADNFEDIITKMIDLIVDTKGLEQLQVGLRKYRIDDILKELE